MALIAIGPLPWHADPWARVLAMRGRGQLPHALLLHGRAGLGKQRFASRLAGSLLCEAPGEEGAACGRCRSCELYGAGTHPDFLILEPEDEGKDIPIDRVREMTQFAALKGSQGVFKVIVLGPAERMNRHAANSLLKTLEEPPANTVLLLVSHAPSLLPATVRSRCQKLAFGTPSRESSGPWLAERVPPDTEVDTLLRLASGSPFHALDLARSGALVQRAAVLKDVRALAAGRADPVAVAAAWNGLGLADALHWLYGLVSDLIRLKHGAVSSQIVNRDAEADLQPLSEALEFKLLFKVLDKCLESRRSLERHSNLNPQFQLEDIAITWTGL